MGVAIRFAACQSALQPLTSDPLPRADDLVMSASKASAARLR